MTEKQLADQVVIVTGGASGIGQCAVNCLRAHGARVASFDITDTATSEDSDLLLVKCDVSLEGQVENAVALVAAQWERIDMLVNCAGILDRFAGVGNTATEDWRRCFAVNVEGPMFLTRACMPYFLRQETKGRIVNFCSTASIRGAACGAAYTASKHALLGLSRSTAWMYAKEGVKCNALLIGPTEGTNITNTGREPDKFGFERVQPYGGLLPALLQANDIMPHLLHLLTAPGVNGAELAVDHGFTTA
ncbi:Secoisolariciresinol dehydrogenase [Lecanosticta acicola]|uniref:Secoisolariciresinol dehydrogenase n=1 Tax=Lecanosticta acicola TaxID=111012 RepID=A0AAI8Z7L9_9PEZI|nr:Secoisolariciresinol dehydrogenase [Lecanosticta acicola]